MNMETAGIGGKGGGGGGQRTYIRRLCTPFRDSYFLDISIEDNHFFMSL